MKCIYIYACVQVIDAFSHVCKGPLSCRRILVPVKGRDCAHMQVGFAGTILVCSGKGHALEE